MKRATAVLLSIVIMLSMITVPSPVLAAGYISICGKQQTLEISPVISDNITYYPICEIAKKLGMSVEEKDSKIVISVNNHWAEFTQQSETAVMDMVTISVKSLFRKNNDIMVEESFFTNYMKYMGFECTMEEMLTFPSIPEITAPEEVESEDTFYRNLDKVGTIIDSSQLFTATIIGGANLVTKVVALKENEVEDCTKALKITTNLEPIAVYDYQLKMYPQLDLLSGNFALLSYWAKAVEISDESGYAYAGPCYEQNYGDYKKAGSANHEIEMSENWKKYYMLISANDENYLKDTSRFNMRFGYKQQSILIAGLKVELLKPGYTKKDVTYAYTENPTYEGREEGALWRDEALKRIEKNRKTNITVNVSDENGNPIKDAEVKSEMIKNNFIFGTAVHNNLLQLSATDGASDKAKLYAKNVLKYFNTVVYDTAGKWPTIEKDRAQYATGIYNWSKENNIDVRGHALFWDNLKFYPESFKQAWDFMTDDERYWRVQEHINENMTYFGNNIKQWDLLNEPLANRNLINIIGVEKTADLFKIAKKIAPNVSFYVNETGINGNNANWLQTRKLAGFVKKLNDNGAQVDGIGIQAHCGTALRYPQEFYNQLDYLATESGVNEIAVTEYDFTVDDEELAADNLRDMLIATYSHPKATGFLTWGFWDGQHWKNNAPFFYSDWRPKQALSVWDNYVNGEWKTSVSGKSDTNGVFSFRGHKGEYSLTIKYGDSEANAVFNTDKSGIINVKIGDEITITPDSIPDIKNTLNSEDYLKYRSDYVLKDNGEIGGTGAKMPVYQLPEEYDSSIIKGNYDGFTQVNVYDDFSRYGTDGKDENGVYINPVTNSNVYGNWYGAQAYDKRGTVINNVDGRYCLSFYRQKNPEVLKSHLSRILKPNGFPIDTKSEAYELNMSFQIPYEEKAIGLRYGRYVKIVLSRTADGMGEQSIVSVLSNGTDPASPILRYGINGQELLKENTWYTLSLRMIPKGTGEMVVLGTLKNSNKTVSLPEQTVYCGNDLRFLGMTVNSYASEEYTRRTFDLGSIEFKKTEFTPLIRFDGQTAIFNGSKGQQQIVAVYRKDTGKLIEARIKMVEVDDVSDAVTVTTALDDNVYARAFLWGENMKPIAFAEWKKE